MNIDRFIQCMRHDKVLPDHSIIPGHNLTPMPAYVEDDIIHLNLICKFCGWICEGSDDYHGETAEQIKQMYGFKLDEPEEKV